MLNYRFIRIIGSAVLGLFAGVAIGAIAYKETRNDAVVLLFFIPVSLTVGLIVNWIAKTNRMRDAEQKSALDRTDRAPVDENSWR